MPGYTGIIGLRKTGQSPVDLVDSLVRLRRYPPLVLSGHWLKDGEATLLNNGRTAMIVLSGERIPSTISGGPLGNDEYEFYNAHFHWGEENCRGAEHTINGTWFSMEAHAVHWNRKYPSFEECLQHRDGICILAYLFLAEPGLCERSNPQLERITENLKYVREENSKVKIPSNSLYWMRSAIKCPKYYTYNGSYNDGDNQECTIWIVFPVITPIRPCQIDQFRNLKDKNGECIKSNWLRTQLLRERSEIYTKNAKLIQELGSIEGKLESPIDLDIGKMTFLELSPLEWSGFEVPPKKLKITNTGYTVMVSAIWQEQRPYISGGPLLGKYVFSQIHFHWGETDMDGSEHTADGASMPMEVHVVHFKSDYSSLETALRREDGVVVLVYFVKLQAAVNQFYEVVVDSLGSVKAAYSSARLLPVSLATVIRPFTQNYFTYWGSVLMTNYAYNVLWIISREPIGLSAEQVAEFRTLKDEKSMPIISNRRPLKERMGRHVFHVSPIGQMYSSLVAVPR